MGYGVCGGSVSAVGVNNCTAVSESVLSVSESVNQSVSQWVSISHSTSYYSYQSVSQSVSQWVSISHSTSYYSYQWVSQSVSESVSQYQPFHLVLLAVSESVLSVSESVSAIPPRITRITETLDVMKYRNSLGHSQSVSQSVRNNVVDNTVVGRTVVIETTRALCVLNTSEISGRKERNI